MTGMDKDEAPNGFSDDALMPGCGLFREGCSCGCWSAASAF